MSLLKGEVTQVEIWGRHARINSDVRGMVAAPVDKVWALFTRWEGLSDWLLTPAGERSVVSSPLREGQTEADLPKTRMVTFIGAHGDAPPLIETLIHADPETHTAYYSIPEPAMGVHDYVCCVTMDGVEGGTMIRFRACLNARADYAEQALAGLLAAHRDCMIPGLNAYLSREP